MPSCERQAKRPGATGFPRFHVAHRGVESAFDSRRLHQSLLTSCRGRDAVTARRGPSAQSRLVEVHAIQQLLEAGIGTNGIDIGSHLDIDDPRIVLGTCPLKQGKRAIVFAKRDP
jgi:hypothetical protein